MAASNSVTAISAAGLQPAKPATKRKNREEVDEDDEDDSGSDVSMINVDFDFYNPNPEVDDIALKRLLRQLLSSDSDLFDVHALAAHVLASARTLGVGSTVKIDGEESDPYAYLSLIDLKDAVMLLNGLTALPCAIWSNAASQQLLSYLISHLPTPSPFRNLLSCVLPSSTTNPYRVALVISERLVNLPVQLVPPMWKMLVDEVRVGSEQGNQSLAFTHYLLLSRVYKMDSGAVTAEDEEDGNMEAESRPSKKSKKVQKKAAAVPEIKGGMYAYHPEEEFLEKVALYTHTFPFQTAQSRDSESFSVEQQGRITLYEAGRLPEGVALMEAGCN